MLVGSSALQNRAAVAGLQYSVVLFLLHVSLDLLYIYHSNNFPLSKKYNG